MQVDSIRQNIADQIYKVTGRCIIGYESNILNPEIGVEPYELLYILKGLESIYGISMINMINPLWTEISVKLLSERILSILESQTAIQAI